MEDNVGYCELCGCKAKLTKHHLCPQVKCRNKYKAIKNDSLNIAMVCRPCHDHIHASFSENELRDNYSTLEKLKSSQEMAKFIEWRKKHPDFDGHAKMSNTRKSRR